MSGALTVSRPVQLLLEATCRMRPAVCALPGVSLSGSRWCLLWKERDHPRGRRGHWSTGRGRWSAAPAGADLPRSRMAAVDFDPELKLISGRGTVAV